MKSSTKIALWTGGAISAALGLIWYEERKAPAVAAPQPIGVAGPGPLTPVAMPAGVTGPYTELLGHPWTLTTGHTYLVQAPSSVIALAQFSQNFTSQFNSPNINTLTILGTYDATELPAGWPNSSAGPRLVFTFTLQAVGVGTTLVGIRGPAGARIYAANGASA
jgi:hypothetical protein